MGDHRAACRIEFEFHGKTYKLNLSWVNWVDSYNGIDRRVLEFFESSYADGMSRWHDAQIEAEEEANAAAREAAERAELARLKAKYEPPSPEPPQA